MVDVRLQRKNMVESQVRPSDVTDRRITAAMLAISRENFVPAQFSNLAYMDDTLEFGGGRFMMAPRALAKLIQLADIDSQDIVLVIGGSCGYAAAIVANLASRVVALLPEPIAASSAEDVLRVAGVANVETEAGELAQGWPAAAPYDAIVIEGGVEAIPYALQSQMAKGGRLVAVEHKKGLSQALIVRKIADVLDGRTTFELSAPLLPGFEATRTTFVF